METNENQPLSPDLLADSQSANQSAKSIQKATNSNELDFSKLTPQNWLFINAFLNSPDIQKAYQLAKYDGRDASAPYQVFKRLKPFIEQIGDLDVTSRARLQANVKQLMALPIDPEKKYLTFSEALRLNKFIASLTPEASNQKQAISVLIINRSKQSDAFDAGDGQKATSNSKPTAIKDVIDAELVDPHNEK